MKDESEKIFGDRKEVIRKFFVIIFVNLLGALTMNLFYIPNNFLSGGVGGISILIYSLTRFPVGISMFIINLPLAYIGYKFLNKKFAFYAIISTFVFSIMVHLSSPLSHYHILHDSLLASVFGGILNGIAMGFLFKNDLCQGGIDFLAKIFKEKYNISIGTALLAMNIIIISLSAFFFGLNRALYTIIAMRASYVVLDKIQVGLDSRKQLYVITGESENVACAILHQMGRGVTFLHGAGAYTNSEKEIIYCVVKNSEIMRAKNLILEIDPTSFITISDVVEVQGRGF